MWMRRIGQLGLPVNAALDDEMVSRIVALDDVADGRAARGGHGNARAWVRRFVRNDDTLYAAAYTTHAHNGVAYTNVAFPLPLSNMSSILRVEPLALHMDSSKLADAGRGGVAFTTRSAQRGDEGVYLTTRFGAMRLPVDETICAWSARHGDNGIAPLEGAHGVTVYARHEMWMWGARYLVLDYFLIRKPT